MRLALDLPPVHLARRLRVLDRAAALSPVAHLVALAFLYPARSADVRASVPLAACAQALHARCERLFARMPRRIAAEDLESAQERGTAIALARSIVGGDDAGELAAAARGDVRIAGDVARDRVSALLPELEGAPLGSVVPWMFAAEMLGGSVWYRGAETAALQPYRASLLVRFATLAEQSPQMFWSALVSADDAELRGRLLVALDALRGAAALAATL